MGIRHSQQLTVIGNRLKATSRGQLNNWLTVDADMASNDETEKSSLCIFCYSSVATLPPHNSNIAGAKRFKSGGGGYGGGFQAKFLLLLSRYLKFTDFVEGRHRVAASELILCQDCADLGDSFCDMFLQLEALQLQLNWQLRTISERIRLSETTPSKRNKFWQQFKCGDRNKKEDTAQLKRREQVGKDIELLRTGFLQHCEQTLNETQQLTPKAIQLKQVGGKDKHKMVNRNDSERSEMGANSGNEERGESEMREEQDEYVSSDTIVKQEEDNRETSQSQTSSSNRKSGRVLHKCSKCSKTFGDQSKLKYHIEIYHQMELGDDEEEDEVEELTEEHNQVDSDNDIQFEGDNDEDGDYGEACGSEDNNHNSGSSGGEDDDEEEEAHEDDRKKVVQKPLTTTRQWTHPDFLPSNKCEVCHQSFISEAAVEKHRVNFHKLVKFVRCQGCGETFRNFKNLRIHRNRPSLPKCFVANIKFLEPASISEFPQYAIGTEHLFCKEEGCFEIFAHSEHLQVHLKTHGSWSCDYCEMVFRKAHELAWHEVTHHNNHEMKSSEATGEGGEPLLKCNRCKSQKTYKKRWFIDHFLSKHLGISKMPQTSQGAKKQCPICKRVFNMQMKKSEIEAHIKMEHEVEGLDPSQVSRCTICQVPFVSPRFLTNHMKRVHQTDRIYSCSECGKTFSRSIGLRYHCRTAHNGEGAENSLRGNYKYKCTLCNEKFTLSNQLAFHMRWHEGKDKRFPCHQCNPVQLFVRKESLRKHVQSKHEPEVIKPFICDLCGKLFGTKDRLKQHVRTHEQHDNPPVCLLCGASFKQESSLRSHMQRMHETQVSSEKEKIPESNSTPFLVGVDN